MLGKAVQTAKLGVLVMEAIAVISVIGGVVYMSSRSGKMMDTLSVKMSEEMRLNKGGVATGGDSEQLQADHDALLALAALPGEAARNNDMLHVGIVSFRNVPPAQNSGYTPVTLSVQKLSRAAALFIPDGPTEWTITNSNINQRAKLAFEGPSPVRAVQLPQGFLAGTRLQSFDAARVSNIHSLDEKRGEFCDTMRAWSQFFAVPLEKTHISKIMISAGDQRLSASDRGFNSRGARVSKRGTAASLCNERNNYQRNG